MLKKFSNFENFFCSFNLPLISLIFDNLYKILLKYFFLFLLIISLSCSNKITKSKDLQGNWYTIKSLKNTNKELDVIYQEIYFSNNQIFCFNSISGFRVPNYYKLQNDSLFISFFLDKDYDFLSKIIYENDNTFSISQIEDRVYFYRLKNVKYSLDKFLIINDSISDFYQKGTEFTQGFINRSQNIYTKK